MTKKTNAKKNSTTAAAPGGIANLKALKEAKQKRIAEGNTAPMHSVTQDHEQPSAKEIANTALADEFATASKPSTTQAPKAGRGAAKPKKGTTTAPQTKDPTRANQRAPKRAAKIAAPKRLSALDLAAKVLAESKQPLNAKVITERVLAAGWATNGRTPQATLYAAMIREIAAKKADSRFTKLERGMFTANPTNKSGA
jgi:hypothetical protein